MPTIKKANAKAPANDWRSPGSPQALGEHEQFAHGIVAERPDLMPSVALIMDADLDAPARLRALTLFGQSLHVRGDVHRDPRVAIARCRQPLPPDRVGP
jgi:hypothetical protein